MWHFSPYAVYDLAIPNEQKYEYKKNNKEENLKDNRNINNDKNFLINHTKENFDQAIKSGLMAKTSILLFLFSISLALIFNNNIKFL